MSHTPFVASASQEQLDALIQSRMARVEAKHAAALAEAVAAAREEGRNEIRQQLAEERVDHALSLALNGRRLAPSAILEGFDKRDFITSDGAADLDAIRAWVAANTLPE